MPERNTEQFNLFETPPTDPDDYKGPKKKIHVKDSSRPVSIPIHHEEPADISGIMGGEIDGNEDDSNSEEEKRGGSYRH